MNADDLLARAERLWPYFHAQPGFDSHPFAEVEALIRGEMTSLPGHMWVPPRWIYFVLADTLAPSGWMALFLGLMVGARLDFKLTSRGMEDFEIGADRLLATLPADLQVATHFSRHWIPERWEQAETVVVFGRDETIAHFRAEVRPWQRFLGYGHKMSAARISGRDGSDASLAAAASDDLLAYRQTGCLSPQLYFCDSRQTARQWAETLAEVLRGRTDTIVPMNFEEAAAVRLARDLCRLGGDTVWEGEEAKWTVVLKDGLEWIAGPGFGFVQILAAPDLLAGLASARGHWSALGYSPVAWPEILERAPVLASFGFSRLCPLGKMQEPTIAWRHDGDLRLAALGRWLTIEATT